MKGESFRSRVYWECAATVYAGNDAWNACFCKLSCDATRHTSHTVCWAQF